MDSKFLDPRNDFAFKKIFGTPDHKAILIHFLNDMIDFKDNAVIKEVEFLKTVQDPEIAYAKQSIVDVLCQDQQGRKYIVEMQVASTDAFIKRAPVLQGIQTGSKQTAHQIARKLISTGMDISQVLAITGLSTQDLLRLGR